MKTTNRIFAATLIIFGLVLVNVTVAAASESELTGLLQELKAKERELYSPEFAYDGCLQQYWKFDGAGGWLGQTIFNRRAFKKLKKDMAKKEATVNRIKSELTILKKKIQNKVYEIAYSYEINGEYQKAIQWYLKLDRINDDVKFRIATCYKLGQEYADALKWFFDISGRGDEVKYEIAETYELWGKVKDAVVWYFKVCDTFSESESDRKALAKLESMDYSDLLNDFPDFYRKLSDIFIDRVFFHHESNPSTCLESYRRAAEVYALHLGIESDRGASKKIVARYRQLYQKAKEVLREQEERAVDHYEEKLWKARRKYDRAKDEYEVELKEAKYEYSRKLNELFHQWRRYDNQYEQYKSEEGRTAEEIASAKRWRDHYEREYRRMQSPIAMERYIDDYVEDEKEAMDRAKDNWEKIAYRREEIIQDYLKPYKRDLEKARDTYDIIRDLHEEAYY